MTAYYIKQTAAGGGDGSEGAPFNSLASLPSLVAGDRVRFLEDYNGQLLYDSGKGDHGTSGNEIVFESVGGPWTVRHSGWCIDINARNYVTVQNLRAGPTGSYADGGIRFLNCENQKVQYCTTEDRCDYGIRIDNTSSTALVGVEVLDNEVLGTFNNSGILIIWGSSEGGVFVDVEVKRNTVRNTGSYASPGEHGPYGIRLIPRATSLTTGAVSPIADLDYFSCGVQLEDNNVYGTPSYGVAYAGIGSGHSASITNRVSWNVLRNNGSGSYDAHVIWVAGCRDVVVEHNDIDGSNVFEGHSYGTGSGIFCDNYGFDDLYNNSKNIVIRRNKIRNTGRNPELSANDNLEVVGAGVTVFLSQDIVVVDNDVEDCANGIAVIGWYGGSSGKSQTVTVRGNRVINPRFACYSVIKAADAVTLQENWGQGYGEMGIYTENAGAYALTSYTETRNNIVGSANDAYMGGSEPTSTATPKAARTPSAGNLTLSPALFCLRTGTDG